jgi:hypothetical protein
MHASGEHIMQFFAHGHFRILRFEQLPERHGALRVARERRHHALRELREGPRHVRELRGQAVRAKLAKDAP